MADQPGGGARPFATDAPLLLTGPPGAGKTTAGRRAADRLGLPFDDLDHLVEAGAGRSVESIFATEGEAGFRARERAALDQVLASPRRRVVSLGGGTLLDPGVRALALRRATVIGLAVSTASLTERLAGSDASRPLLAGPPEVRAARLQRLLDERRGVYEQVHVVLDGDRPGPVVAGDIARAAADRFAWVTSRDGGYPVRLAGDAGAAVADAARGLRSGSLHPRSLHLVADARLAPTWAGAVAAALAAAGAPAASLSTVPSGEEHKRIALLEHLAEALLAAGADRGSALCAIGGGVTSDVCGLLAALYFRGVPWIAVPTTVLAMVDAAVGGKTAVDLARAKNVLGAFHPPRAVIVDPAHARTESPRQIRAGLAEAVKTALVGDPELLALLESAPEEAARGEPALLLEIVARALAVKIAIVGRDEHETGERAHLNLGHTLGHALEAAAGYGALAHGEAVAIGTVAALRVGEDLGVTERGLAARVARLLGRLQLPTEAPPALCRAAAPLVGSDKKRSGDTIRLVLIHTPGAPRVLDMPAGPLGERLAAAASSP